MSIAGARSDPRANSARDRNRRRRRNGISSPIRWPPLVTANESPPFDGIHDLFRPHPQVALADLPFRNHVAQRSTE